MKNSGAFRAIFPAGLIVGVLDISSAFIIWWQRGVGWRRGLQGLAAGLLGAKSYDGGLITAGLGLALHFFVAFAVVSVFYLASRKIEFLTHHAFVSGVLYGIGVYIVMYWFVLPMTFPTFRHRLGNELLAVAIHISLIGLPCALIVRRYLSTNALFIMKDPFDFTGKVALVTGSSRGIGAEMIKAFGTRAAQCVVNYVADAQGQNRTDALAVAKELNKPLVIECDVTQPQQVDAMMKQIQEQCGGLDVLVNNSGIISDRTIKKMSLEEFESVIRVNLVGAFTVTQKAAAILRHGGRVINMSSVSGQMGLFGQANYSASKAGIIALTKVSARELARQNITVNAIAPGFIDVGMSKGMPEEVTQNFIKQIPLGRLGEAHEIVDAALFLASPMASYITGQVLNVNGGFYLG